MSLLHQETTEVLDDAAQGEEFTRGSSNVLMAALVAAVIISIAVAVYVFMGQKPPVATGEVLAVWAHPQHTETSGLDANGEPVPKQIYDQVMVFARVRVHNQSQNPLVLTSVATDATMPDGISSCYAASAMDYNRLFVAYPQLPVPHGSALKTTELTIKPGDTVEGTFVSAFLMDKAQWDKHAKLTFSLALQYQKKLLLEPKTPVTEL